MRLICGYLLGSKISETLITTQGTIIICLIFVIENIFKSKNTANHSAKILLIIELVSRLMGSSNKAHLQTKTLDSNLKRIWSLILMIHGVDISRMAQVKEMWLLMFIVRKN